MRERTNILCPVIVGKVNGFHALNNMRSEKRMKKRIFLCKKEMLIDVSKTFQQTKDITH
jgi:hypothetical protein